MIYNFYIFAKNARYAYKIRKNDFQRRKCIRFPSNFQ